MILKIFSLFFLVQLVFSDTPANCTFADAVGQWKINIYDFNINCNSANPTNLTKTFNLIYPNVVTDEFGNFGLWTLIYNQGFEVKINNKKYFGFFDFKKINSSYSISYCNRLQPNWYHDVLIRQWGCFRAQKVDSDNVNYYRLPHLDTFVLTSVLYGSQQSLVDTINKKNVGWTAKDYPEFHEKTLYEIRNMVGGINSNLRRPKPARVSKVLMETLKALPDSFDWRNVNGINYVSPVRNQANCGSCYSFASAAMLEARYRIRSNNTITPILSPQDVVECSPYSQGCDGGFPYLIAGKYAEDFGMVEEHCNPYKGYDNKCSTNTTCSRYYATKYRYIGGFYGATNEPLMRLELIEKGPFAVGFEVYNDFMTYSGGVYHHVFNNSPFKAGRFDFNPFELTNHAVLVVGYGQTSSGEKFWIVKNSWSANWGENGYFRIRRGNDECGIESLGVSSEPII